ncbi:alpha/beta-type small acid-soluble spore protein [Clostridium sp. MT-14]|uniref:alpha/beta-type small acid-soluble spore protein n=1 Tax=Clostridium sp. MT-14 TaxID=3348360 RepID=UPI0035F29480
MYNDKLTTSQSKEALKHFKIKSAKEIGINLKEGYNGDLTSREAGSIGGNMVKKMVEAYKQNLK